MTDISISWKNITPSVITSYFLYGVATKPNDEEDRLRPSDAETINFKVDMKEFMTDSSSPARFAYPALAPIMTKFFKEGFLTGTNQSYTVADLKTSHGCTDQDFQFSVIQYLFGVDDADYGERSYIYNSTSFKLSDDTVFTVSGSTVTITDLSVRPFDDNFDFDSGSIAGTLGNSLFLEPVIDPYGIGKTVNIEYDDTSNPLPTRTYTSADFIKDIKMHNLNKYTEIDVITEKLNPAVTDVVEQLDNSDVFEYSNPIGGKVVYGSNDADEQLIGTSGDDIIVAGEGDDIITGTSGDDFVIGGDDYDILTFEGSQSPLVFEGGIYKVEELRGSSFNDVFYLSAAAGYDLKIDGKAGFDTYDLGDGSADGFHHKIIVDNGGALILDGVRLETFQKNLILGGYYSTSPNISLSIDGNDLVLHYGDPGNDSYRIVDGYSNRKAWGITLKKASAGTALSDFLDGDDQEDDTILSYASADTIRGLKGNDTLDAGDDDDTVEGGDDDDILIGGDGADSLDGGNGIDWAYYNSSSSAVTVNLTTNINTGGEAQGDTLTDIENIRGSSHNDTFTGDSVANIIWGGGGADTLNGEGGDDILLGENGADIINGGNGDDTINGGAGGDTIDGGAGIYDIVTYETSSFAVNVNIGTNTHSGGDAAGDSISNVEDIKGSAYNDTLTGTSGANRIWGNAGNDTINGGDGDDMFVGGAGSDTLNGGNGYDRAAYYDSPSAVSINLSTNSISGGDANGDVFNSIEDLEGSNFADILIGDSDDNLILGMGSDDDIQGLAGGDFLYGYDGDDIIEGGADGDTINGGNGNDTASYVSSNAGVIINLTTNSYSGGHAASDTITSIESIIGSSYADTITGNSLANTLTGGNGDDYIYGNDGNDILIGGAGVDYIEGGDGNDTIYAQDINNNGSFSNFYDGNEIYGGAGDDIIYGSNDGETIYAGDDNDTIHIAGALFAAYYGDAGNDIFYEGSGTFAVSASGGTGNDTFYANVGSTTFLGGDGVDTVSFINAPDAVTADLVSFSNLGTYAQGDSYNDVENIEGSAFDDIIIGNSLTNTFWGFEGNDILDGGVGADILDGGNGTDTASYDTSASAVTINLGSSTYSGGSATGDTLISIENITGSFYADTLTGDNQDNIIKGRNGNDTINGGDGDDTIEGGAGGDTINGGNGIDTITYVSSSSAVTINLVTNTHSGGEAASDSISNVENVIGSAYADTITGNAIDNILNGGAGNDTLNGGDGWDILIGGAGGDTINGGNGEDTVSYSTSSAGVTVNLATNTHSGGDAAGDSISNVEDVWGSIYSDVITGNSSNNFIFGGDGDYSDTLSGGDGDDIIVGGGGTDTIYGGNGNDIIYAHNINDSGAYNPTPFYFYADYIEGGDGDDIIYASNAGDEIYGDDGNDILRGNRSTDELRGGNGNDIIIGGREQDHCYGGAGADTFVFETLLDSTTPLRDFIYDFTVGTDKLDVSALGFTDISDFTITNTTLSGGNLTMISDANSTFSMYLSEWLTLSNSDFIF